MSSFLVCSSPILGHLAPLAALSAELVRRGHSVTILSGTKYADRVQRAGATFTPLPAAVDYDDADLDSWLPDRASRRGLAAVRYDMVGMFVRVIPEQHAAVRSTLGSGRYDAVIGEFGFTGLLPTLLTVPAGERIPIVAVSVAPITLTSVDTAPFGTGLQPMRGPLGRLRNRLLNAVVLKGVLGPAQRATDSTLATLGVPPAPGSFFDLARAYDRTFHLGLERLEYPRREAPASLRFLGPLRGAVTGVASPPWWGDLDGRRIVHVTQGTIDNADLTRLVVPTIKALAGEDLLVVAATGGRPVDEVLRHFPDGLPANARVADMVPYDLLLPRAALVVTNGGFGGVQQALAAGVPLVVAGSTEDKPEVAARVAWAGAGVNLRSGTPKERAIRVGVRRVLDDARFAQTAGRLAAEFAAAPDPVDAIVAELDDLVQRRPTARDELGSGGASLPAPSLPPTRGRRDSAG